MSGIDPTRWRELNRAWWDERVPHHVASPLYDDESFRAGRSSLRPFELELVGDVTGLRLVHLQCHFGHDSLSWARQGASVVGLDFSQPAVDTANRLAADLGLDGRFVCSDVYDAVAALEGERFDLVYTGRGALNWLPDLEAWADVVAALLAPGGRLFLTEFHPFAWTFADEDLAVAYDYFDESALTFDEPGTYADLQRETENNRTVEHQHTLASVFGVLLRRGFTFRAYEEHDHTLYPRWPFLELHDDGSYRFPAGQATLPLMYALLADAPT